MLKSRKLNILPQHILANNQKITILIKSFEALTSTELYHALQLREDVFQLEQNCLYKDIDGKDLYCQHVLVYLDKDLVAYTRIVPEGISYSGYVSIGRVVTKSNYRKDGYGKQVMRITMDEIQKRYPDLPIKISAQAYLQQFYEVFGFVKISEPYLEDDIPHIAMVYFKKKSVF